MTAEASRRDPGPGGLMRRHLGAPLLATWATGLQGLSLANAREAGAAVDPNSDATDALQRALDASDVLVLAPGAVYQVRTIVLRNRRQGILGNGATLKRLPGWNGGAVLASEAFLQRWNHAQAPFWIDRLVIDGGGLADYGLAWQGWSSEARSIEVTGCRLAGIHITAMGDRPFEHSTLVNNRILHAVIHDNQGHGIEVRDPARNRATDGIIDHALIYGCKGWGIRLDSAAGWRITAHIYGNEGGIWINAGGQGTLVGPCYIEQPRVEPPSPSTGEALWIRAITSAPALRFFDSFVRGRVVFEGQGGPARRCLWSSRNVYELAEPFVNLGSDDNAWICSDNDCFGTSDSLALPGTGRIRRRGALGDDLGSLR